jgi:hypothetical protein
MKMTRFEKLDYLLETCPAGFITDCTMLREMARWMPEREFNELFDRLCSLRDIKNPEEEEEMNEFTVENEDEMVFSA